jgi:hypothetical protein
MRQEIGGIVELGGRADDLRVPDVDVAAAAENKEAGTMGESGTAVVWRFRRTGWTGNGASVFHWQNSSMGTGMTGERVD